MPERASDSQQAGIELRGHAGAPETVREDDSRTEDATVASGIESEYYKSSIGTELADERYFDSSPFSPTRSWSVDDLCQAAGFANAKSAAAWAAELHSRVLFPTAAVLQWWFFNVFLVLLNKWIFQASVDATLLGSAILDHMRAW